MLHAATSVNAAPNQQTCAPPVSIQDYATYLDRIARWPVVYPVDRVVDGCIAELKRVVQQAMASTPTDAEQPAKDAGPGPDNDADEDVLPPRFGSAARPRL